MKYQLQRLNENKITWSYIPCWPETIDGVKDKFMIMCVENPEITIRIVSVVGDTNIPYEVLFFKKGKN